LLLLLVVRQSRTDIAAAARACVAADVASHIDGHAKRQHVVDKRCRRSGFATKLVRTFYEQRTSEQMLLVFFQDVEQRVNVVDGAKHDETEASLYRNKGAVDDSEMRVLTKAKQDDVTKAHALAQSTK
jgi:hypothetical protein